MKQEDIFFRGYLPVYVKLTEYGFKEIKKSYVYERNFLNDAFKAVISVQNDGKIQTKVYDIENKEEYLPLRCENSEGKFVGEVRKAYYSVLTDIRNQCFEKKYFVSPQANRIALLIENKYGEHPVFMWKKFPTYGVFKNHKNNKWYGIIMYIERSKLGINAEDMVEIINLKLDKNKIPELIENKGIYPAWHMNKKYWVSIALDESLSDTEIMKFIDESYSYTLQKNIKK